MYPSNWTKHISSNFFNLTLRVLLLRTICCLALATFIDSLVIGGFEYYVSLPVYLVTFIHQVAITFHWHFDSGLNGFWDLLFTLSEIGPIGYFSASRNLDTFSPRKIVFAATLSWMLFIFLLISLLLKLVDTIKARGVNLRERYDFTGAKWLCNSAANGSDTADITNRNTNAFKPLNSWEIFLGRELWKAHFLGETNWMIFFRGVLAALFVVVIVIFALINIVLEPVRETSLTPVNNLRASDLPWDLTSSTQPVWNVVVVRLTNDTDANPDFSHAVEVVPLWNSNNNKPRPPCSLLPSKTLRIVYGKDHVIHAITLHCPSREENPARRLDFLLGPYYDIRPDVLVTVNFTKLGIPSDSIYDIPRNSVQIMVGLTNNTEHVMRRTSPTSLIPGSNLVGMANLIILEQLRKPKLSAFGLFDDYETYLISEIVHVWPDPQAGTSPLIAQGSEVATIRITPQNDPSEWKIIRDYRDKSVLKGFASVGGLWAALGGIFAVLFGSSIIRIIFGMKPLSLLGLMHAFQEDKIRDAYLQKYPRVLSDVQSKPGDRGLVALLCDYVIDVGFITESESTNLLNPGSPVDDSVETRAGSIPLVSLQITSGSPTPPDIASAGPSTSVPENHLVSPSSIVK